MLSPLAALRLDAEVVAGLGKLGLETVGDLERTPRAPLALRFGPGLTRRLDQAYGRTAETFDPISAPELVRVRRAFFEPIGAPETIARRTTELVERLCRELEARGLGARTLDLISERVDGRREAVRIGTAAPLRDPKRLIRLFRDKLGYIDPGFGIEAMSLAAALAEPLGPTQTVTSLDTSAKRIDVTGLVDILANRLGSDKVYRLAPVDSDVPERCVQRVAPTAPLTGRTWPARWPRPSRLLSPPERVEAMAVLPDQPPAAFTWRGQRRRVRVADGPERVFGEWWRRDAETPGGAGLFQRGGRGGRAVLALPPGRRRDRRHGRPQLVFARSVRVTTDHPLRKIIHIDMDAFFASVEQRDRPELRGHAGGGRGLARPRRGGRGELRGAGLRRALGYALGDGGAPLPGAGVRQAAL